MKRRQFLKWSSGAGAATILSPAFFEFYRHATQGLISKAEAQASGNVEARRYINFNMLGAPGRYVFDQWLKLRDNEQFDGRCAQVKTALKLTGPSVEAEYRLSSQLYNGIRVTPLWENVVQTSRGSFPLSDLLQNMLVVRGYGTGVDGHISNNLIQQMPVGGKPSLSGVAADTSTKTFEAVQWPPRGPWSTFGSDRKIAMNVLSKDNPALEIIEPSRRPEKTDRQMTWEFAQNHKAALDLTRSRLKQYIQGDRLGSDALRKSFDNSLRAVASAQDGLVDQWTALVTKYQDVISNAYHADNMPGYTDGNITTDTRIDDDLSVWSMQAGTRIVPAAKDLDFKAPLLQKSNSRFYRIAESFAFAEYMIVNNLSQSIELGQIDGLIGRDLTGLDFKGGRGQETQNGVFHMVCDMHESGAISMVLYSAAYFRALAAALLELKQTLMATLAPDGKPHWESTVFQFSSDFGRYPRLEGHGSDHGFDMMITSAFTGAFTNGPHVVGDIALNADNLGSIGIRAPIEGYRTDLPTPAFMASQIAELLGLKTNPYRNLWEPLVQLQSGALQVQIPGRIKTG